MRALTLTLPWSQAFSLVCEVALSGVVKGPGTTMSTLTGLFMVISAFKGCLCLGNKHKLKVENQNWEAIY